MEPRPAPIVGGRGDDRLNVVTSSEVVSFLTRPGVERIETHLSWVFRDATEVLKLKKPVLFGGLDLRAIDARRRNCETELDLNRRFAHHVYLGVVSVCRGPDGSLHLGAPGTPVDWLVRMRRLPDQGFLDRKIASGDIDHALVRRALSAVVRHHIWAPPAPLDADAYIRGLLAMLDRVERDLDTSAIDGGRVAATLFTLRGWVATHRGLFGRRVDEWWIVEGHGDLRPEHVCLAPEPVVIDCLEFDATLRTLDAVDDLGFLALECDQLGARDVAATVMDLWRTESGDDFPPSLLAFYQAVRALRRASVAAMRLREGANPAKSGVLVTRVARYLAAAEALANSLVAH